MDSLVINQKLIDAIKRHLPENRPLAATLMDILSLGREAVYRRLRNEVPFTLAEAIRISIKLGIPSDEIIDGTVTHEKAKWALFDTSLFLSANNFYEQCIRKMEVFVDIFGNMQQAQRAVLRSATNMVPLAFVLEHRMLTRFIVYKWYFLTQGVHPDFRLADMEIPAGIREYEKTLVKNIKLNPKTLFIFDRGIFSTLVNEIRYFYQRRLISDSELSQIRDEILSTISSMEHVTETGEFESGGEVTIYLSDIDLDASYLHLECDDCAFCFQRLYYIDFLNFSNAAICHEQKNWIELLKRYSIQITQSSELQRFEFFKQQRELVEGLLQASSEDSNV